MHQADLLGNDADATPHRLFFALWPDPALRKRIATTVAGLERDNAPGGRRLNPDRYHLTLQFLGDFQPLRQSVVDAAIVAADSMRLPDTRACPTPGGGTVRAPPLEGCSCANWKRGG